MCLNKIRNGLLMSEQSQKWAVNVSEQDQKWVINVSEQDQK